MRKFVTAAVAIAMLAAGGAAFAVINPLSGVGAQDPPSTTVPNRTPSQGHGRGGRVLEAALAELVQKGTITQAQADAVKEAVKAKAQDRSGGPGGGDHGGPRFLADAVKTAADVIGITPADLTAQLRSGESLADVATSKGVDPQKVIDASVTKANAAVDQAVQNGKLTADQAAKIKAKLPNLVPRLVNHKGGQGMGGRGMGMGAWRHRAGGQGEGAAPTTSAPTHS